MESIRSPLHNFTTTMRLATLAALLLMPIDSFAQVRTKKPDRGVYRPPSVDRAVKDGDAESFSDLIRTRSEAPLAADEPTTAQRQGKTKRTDAKWGAPLVDTELTKASSTSSRRTTSKRQPRIAPQPPKLRSISSERSKQPSNAVEPRRDAAPPSRIERAQLTPPHRPQQVGNEIEVAGGEVWVDEGEVYYEPESYAPVLDPSCGACDGCDSGCDSIGCDNINKWCNSANAYLSLSPDRWFASAELMLMFRKGDGLPALVTTGDSVRNEGNDIVSNEDQAGQIGQEDTRVLAGDEVIFNDMMAGGRFTIGTWLDCHRCRSLVARGWFAGEERYRFFADEDGFPVLARPFLNVDDGEDPSQDALLIAFPEVEIDDPDNAGETIVIPARANGSVGVLGESNVYGADISIRQLWYGKYGGTVDLLYGYQYLRMDENLVIGSISTSLDEDFAPVGSTLAVRDTFDAKNDFHGAQFGLASNYREGCWSFRGLLKLGAGGLQRRAKLRGQTTTSIDGAVAVDPNGLLVRSTNIGDYNDTVFAWSPELDLTLGWQRFPRFDVTFGYHMVALTDALQVSGMIDPELAVNTSTPPQNTQRPTAIFHHNTYYVQGIHFGLHYIY